MSGARYIFGKNAVKALLDSQPEKVFKLFVAEGFKPDNRMQSIQETARGRGIPIQIVPRTRLDQMLRDTSPPRDSNPPKDAAPPTDAVQGAVQADREPLVHQGIVASVAPRALLTLPTLLAACKTRIAAGETPRLLLLDSITDARNFGAILRVADAAGVEGVIITKHHSAGFGPGVSKTASGAEETVPVAVVANLSQAIRDLKTAGFWIAGAAHTPEATPYYRQDYAMPIALVMGSEDKGLARLVREHCDFLVQIPMLGTVESLNVATATAVLLFEMIRPVAKKAKPEKADS